MKKSFIHIPISLAAFFLYTYLFSFLIGMIATMIFGDISTKIANMLYAICYFIAGFESTRLAIYLAEDKNKSKYRTIFISLLAIVSAFMVFLQVFTEFVTYETEQPVIGHPLIVFLQYASAIAGAVWAGKRGISQVRKQEAEKP